MQPTLCLAGFQRPDACFLLFLTAYSHIPVHGCLVFTCSLLLHMHNFAVLSFTVLVVLHDPVLCLAIHIDMCTHLHAMFDETV